MISVPQINDRAGSRTCPNQLGDAEEPVAAVLMHMLGDLTGRTLLVFPRADGARGCATCCCSGRPARREFGELEQSALKEAGNILSAAYMNALQRVHGDDAAAVAAEPGRSTCRRRC